MPSRNLIKIDVDNGYYHIYNRGVEKRIIFENVEDYKVFLGYLNQYLSSAEDAKKLVQKFILQGSTFQGIPHQPKNYYGKIELLAYCLMPNHFHLLIRQIEKGSMKSFMKAICTRYSMYFNKKYERVGPLFQGVYKAVLVENDNYLLHLSRYIHLNPAEITKNIKSAYSSYEDYLGIRKTNWVKPEQILGFFKQANNKIFKKVLTYEGFVESYEPDIGTMPENIAIEN
jgi:putative transposase